MSRWAGPFEPRREHPEFRLAELLSVAISEIPNIQYFQAQNLQKHPNHLAKDLHIAGYKGDQLVPSARGFSDKGDKWACEQQALKVLKNSPLIQGRITSAGITSAGITSAAITPNASTSFNREDYTAEQCKDLATAIRAGRDGCAMSLEARQAYCAVLLFWYLEKTEFEKTGFEKTESDRKEDLRRLLELIKGLSAEEVTWDKKLQNHFSKLQNYASNGKNVSEYCKEIDSEVSEVCSRISSKCAETWVEECSESSVGCSENFTTSGREKGKNCKERYCWIVMYELASLMKDPMTRDLLMKLALHRLVNDEGDLIDVLWKTAGWQGSNVNGVVTVRDSHRLPSVPNPVSTKENIAVNIGNKEDPVRKEKAYLLLERSDLLLADVMQTLKEKSDLLRADAVQKLRQNPITSPPLPRHGKVIRKFLRNLRWKRSKRSKKRKSLL